MVGSLGRSALAAAVALLLPAAVFSEEPLCSVKNKGYVDPNVTVVNGGLPVLDAAECQRTCMGLATCKVFTWYVNSGGCWLQGLTGVVPPLQDLPGVISGPSNCSGFNATAPVSMSASAVTVTTEAPTQPVAAEVASGNESSVNATADEVGVRTQAETAAAKDKEEAAASSGHFPIFLTIAAALAATGVCVFLGYTAFTKKEKKGAQKSRRTRKADLEDPSASHITDETPLVAAVAAPPVAAAPVGPATSPAMQARAVGPLIQPPLAYAQQAAAQVAPPPAPVMAVAAAAMPPVIAPTPPVPQGVFTPSPVAIAMQSVQSVQSQTWAGPREPVATPMVPLMAPREPIAASAPPLRVPREPIATSAPPQDLFARLDRNHDGVLTRAEFDQLATGLR